MPVFIRILFSAVLLISFSAAAQRGIDGNKTVTTAATIVNEYTTLTADAAAGATTITVAASGLNANSRFGAGNNLAAGDLIMIIQMQGATILGQPDTWTPTISNPNDPTWGTVTNYNNCGKYEFAEVAAVPASGTAITLRCGLSNSYTAAGRVQVIRVPRYNSLTVTSPGVITGQTWNGSTGGVVAIEVLNNTVINTGARISASSIGFRGGALFTTSGRVSTTLYSCVSLDVGTNKGESIAGYDADYTPYGGKYCRGAAANGGGGANVWNCGGGGGGNAGAVASWTGQGTPDTMAVAPATIANWKAAWNLESPGFATSSSSGGGRGGYSFASSNQNAITTGPGNTAWSGANRENRGGLGGRPLDYSTGRIFMGGGGGAGERDDGAATAGAPGAGIVYLLNYGTVSGAGQMNADGGTAGNSGIDGAGGAGAGGVIILNSVGSITGITMTAKGGNGGSQVISSFLSESEGPGGGGGGGYIALSNGVISQSASGGVNGTSNCSSVTEFIPNGATKGAAGLVNQPISTDTVNASDVSICAGNTATLTASLVGTIPATIVWYSAAAGGTVLGTGASFTTPVLTTTTTYYVGFCPGTYTKPVTVTVLPGPITTVNSPSICAGQTANLTAGGATTYTWSAGATVTGASTATATPAVTTTYTVTGTNGGCTSTAISTVTVTPLPSVTVNSPTICAGQSAALTASGATSYTWSAGATSTGTNTATATPSSTTTYTVTGTNSGCSSTATATVTVTPLPVITVNSPTICSGQTAILSGSGGTSYTWSAGATSTGVNTADASPASTTSYTVTGTTSGCSATAVSTVTVNPSPNVTVNSATICAGQTATLTAGGATSYSWSAGATVTGANTATVSPSSTSTFTVTGTSAGCPGTAISTITVNPVADATITSVSPVCAGSPAFNMTAAQPGGTWSGTGITSAAAGTFNPSSSGTGTFTITYTIAGACGNTDTALVTVSPVPNATITGVSPVCFGSAPFNFTAATGGGTWSGTGITNSSSGTFTPSAAGTGTFIITYTIPGSCGSSDTTAIVVNPNADATIVQPAPVCVSASAITLSAATSGGLWTGTGITSGSAGTFNPSSAGIGTWMITYMIGGSCGSSDTVLVTVNATADATISPVSPVCVGAPAFGLTAATSGGTWSGTGITDSISGTFDPATAGTGTYVITYTLTGSCGASDTALISVTTLDDVTIAAQPALCIGDVSVTLTAATAGGNWSGTGITNSTAGTFDPGTAGVGTHLITYTVTGPCGNTDTMNIVVTGPVMASIVAVAPVCANSPVAILSASPSGGIWSGSGITSASGGTFDPSIAGAGTHTITYGIAGACGDTATQSITVNPLPTPTFSSDVNSGCVPLCVNFNEAASNSCSAVLFDFGDGVTSASSSPTHCYTAPGTYSVAITCTDSNSCTGSQTVASMITANPLPTALFTTSATVVPANSPVSFNDVSTGGISSLWDFGDPSSLTNTSLLTNPSHTYSSEGTFCITLVSSTAAGCSDTTQDCILVANEATFSVPNVFTPNGDGNNDEFFITTTSVKTLNCVIYDRWGLQIAELKGVNTRWDGRTTSGNFAPDGVYYYLLNLTAFNGKQFSAQGFVQLLSAKQ